MAGCANISQLRDILQLLNNLKLRKNESSQAVELNWMISLLLKSIYIVLQQVLSGGGAILVDHVTMITPTEH